MRARENGPAASTKVYRDYDQAGLDAQYDQRTLVPDLAPYLRRWRDDSAAAHAALLEQPLAPSPAAASASSCPPLRACSAGLKAPTAHTVRLDVAYGPGPMERLDLFEAERPCGLVVYLHGGAWRMLSKAESAYPAPALLRQRLSFAALDFALVPQVNLRTQVQQCRAALAWLYRHAQAAGASRMCVLGHSSGAHLAALLATTDWSAEAGLPRDVVKSAVLVSGVYDLEPVRLSARNDYLQLAERDVLDLSPLNHVRPGSCPVLVAWGDAELAEFQRQSDDLAGTWLDVGNRCQRLTLAGANHFDMSLAFAEDGTQLHTALVTIALGR